MNHWVLGFILVLLVAATCAAAVKVVRTKQKSAQAHALQALLKLRSLIAFSQKHRGMSAAFIQGDNAADTELQQIKSAIAPLLNALNADTMVNSQERWAGYMDHWGRLAQQGNKYALTESFEQHTNLITNLLYLFEDISEQQQFDQYTFVNNPNIDLLWKSLPFTGEFIGQARAIGVAIVTKGRCSQVDKVKLGYLETKIQQYCDTVFTQLERNKNQPNAVSNSIDQAKQACQTFVQLLSADVLNATLITISAKTYFDTASAAMNQINRLLDEELALLDGQIDAN